MKKTFVWWLVLLLAMLAMAGCTPEENTNTNDPGTSDPVTETTENSGEQGEASPETPTEEDAPQPTITQADFQISDLYDLSVGNSWTYRGMLEYQRMETLVNMETDMQTGVKTYFIEGEVEDMSDAEGGDTSFLKVYAVGPDQLVEKLTDQDQVVRLQGPLVVGQTWSTQWYDASLSGLIDVQGTITEITADEIEVTMVAKGDLVPQWRKGFRQVTQWKVGQGIVKETNHIGYQDGQGFDLVVDKATVSEIPYDGFVSRYVKPSQTLKLLYPRTSGQVQVMMARALTDLYGATTDAGIERVYTNFVNQFTDLDLQGFNHGLRLATTMKNYHGEDGTAFIQPLSQLLEKQAGLLDGLTWEQPDLDMVFGGLFEFEDYTQTLEPQLYRDTYTDEEKAIARMMKIGRIQLFYDEGYPTYMVSPRAYEAMERLTDDPATLAWLKAVREERKIGFYFVDAGLAMGWNTFGERLGQMDRLITSYPEHWGTPAFVDRYNQVIGFFVDPNMELDNTPKFFNGVMGSEVIQAYEQTIETYPRATFTPMLREFLAAVKKAQGVMNLDLNEVYQKYGYGLSDSDPKIQALKEKQQQLVERSFLKSRGDFDTEGYTIKRVSTPEDFIQAIGNDTHIIVEAPSLVFTYIPETDFVKPGEFGGIEISGVKNLLIQGADVSDILTNDYGLVLTLKDSENVMLQNVRMGHLNLFCRDGVILLDNVNQFHMDKSILFGCGWYGLQGRSTEGVRITGSLISDCETYALRFEDSKDIYVKNTAMIRNGRTGLELQDSTGVVFEESRIAGGSYAMFPDRGLVHVTGQSEVMFDKVTLEPYEDKVTFTGNVEPTIQK